MDKYPWNTSDKTDADILGNLLAILNGDGGHYQAEHGRTEAVAHALDRHYDRIMRMDKTAQIYDKESMELALNGDMGEYKRGYYTACARVSAILDGKEDA